MARDFERSSSHFIDVGKATMTVRLDGAAACSISAIIDIESIGEAGSQDIFSIGTSSAGQGAIVFGIDLSGDLFLGGRSGTGDSFQIGSGDANLSAISYVVGGYMDIANDKIRVYIDGTPQTEASVTFGNAVFNTGIPNTNNVIGVNATTGSQFWDGTIAELGIWDVKLSADEFLILANKYSPLFVRPQNLVGYLRLIRGINDEILGIVGSNNGTTVVSHPSIIYPANVKVGVPVAGAPPSGNPWYQYAQEH